MSATKCIRKRICILERRHIHRARRDLHLLCILTAKSRLSTRNHPGSDENAGLNRASSLDCRIDGIRIVFPGRLTSLSERFVQALLIAATAACLVKIKSDDYCDSPRRAARTVHFAQNACCYWARPVSAHNGCSLVRVAKRSCVSKPDQPSVIARPESATSQPSIGEQKRELWNSVEKNLAESATSGGGSPLSGIG